MSDDAYVNLTENRQEATSKENQVCESFQMWMFGITFTEYKRLFDVRGWEFILTKFIQLQSISTDALIVRINVNIHLLSIKNTEEQRKQAQNLGIKFNFKNFSSKMKR